MLFLLFARLVDDCVAAVALSVARQRAALVESTVVLSRLPSRNHYFASPRDPRAAKMLHAA